MFAGVGVRRYAAQLTLGLRCCAILRAYDTRCALLLSDAVFSKATSLLAVIFKFYIYIKLVLVAGVASFVTLSLVWRLSRPP